MEARTEALQRIMEIVESVPETETTFISIATVVGGVLRNVLSAEKTVASATISLAQRTQMEQMRNETSEMIEALGVILPERVSLKKVEAEKEPSWWFALSEVNHVLEESIDQLSTLVSQQEKGSAVRDLIAQAVRLMREHYNVYMEEARNWMDG